MSGLGLIVNADDFGISEAVNRGIVEAHDRGIVTSTSIMAMLLPDEEREGGERAAAKRLLDPAQAASLRPIVAEALEARGQLLIASCKGKPEWIGRTIHDIAAAEGREPVDVGLEVLRDAKAQGVNFGFEYRY